ncbi:MAG: hypothetical protein ACJ72W_03035 [Actinoallomurus sp.]
MKDGLRIALAVVVGYLMGRSRKVRMALTLAAARRLSKNSSGLVEQGTKLLGTSPEVKALTDTVRARIVEAGKAAAVSAVSSRIDALSDRLQERTDALRRPQPRAHTCEDQGTNRPVGRGQPVVREPEVHDVTEPRSSR